MATAFGVFANGGNKTDVTNILKIQDTKERGLYELQPKKKVMDEGIAYIISGIFFLDNFARRWAFGTNSALKSLDIKSRSRREPLMKKDNWDHRLHS